MNLLHKVMHSRHTAVVLVLLYLGALVGYSRGGTSENERLGATGLLLGSIISQVVPDLKVAKVQTPSVAPPKATPDFTFSKEARPQLAPQTGGNDSLKFEYYSQLAQGLGLNTRGIVVIGFRGMAPDRVRHPSSDNASNYDDTFVVLDGERKQAWEFLGSTHAGQFRSSLAPLGVAQIQPGLYRADPCGEYAEMPCWLVTTQGGAEVIPCWRDADADGQIGTVEKRESTVATEILFHNGRYQEYGSSIGCQVLPPDLMAEFIEVIGKSNGFVYLLLDANAPMPS